MQGRVHSIATSLTNQAYVICYHSRSRDRTDDTRHVTNPPAIVLDGHQRSSLATTRSLGRHGCQVIVAETERRCLAATSRYCAETLVYPDPSEQPQAFADWLGELGERRPGSVLMPMTDLTVPLVLRHAPSSLRTALPTLSAYESVSDKYTLFQHATRTGVRVPFTMSVTRANLDAVNAGELRYPVVVKPRRSATRTAAGVVKRTVRYAHSPDELRRTIDGMLVDDEDEALLQEYVSGVGEGVFALYDRGQPVFFFAHRRLREKPPSGGVSVLCESIRPNENALRAVHSILDPLPWHGVAMIEFKVDSSGTAWLIEINARFWGSLQLAVDAGADFPVLLYQLASGSRLATPDEFRIGRQLRWLLGDLDNLYATLTQRQFAPTLREKLAAIARFCIPWRPGLRYELLRLADPFPAFFATARYVSSLKR